MATETVIFSSRELKDFRDLLLDIEEANGKIDLIAGILSEILGMFEVPETLAKILEGLNYKDIAVSIVDTFIDDSLEKIVALSRLWDDVYQAKLKLTYTKQTTPTGGVWFSSLDFDIIAIQVTADSPWTELV